MSSAAELLAQAERGLAAIKLEAAKRNLLTPKDFAKKYFDDPLGFVMAEWPWGEKDGPLAHSEGPDELQTEFLVDLGKEIKLRNFDGKNPVAPVRMSISSGHGVGKTSMLAWITWFILVTRPNSIGTVTAGTFQQLEERTWADICFWGRMAKHGYLFNVMKTGIAHKDPKMAPRWKVNPKTSAKERAQAFAGQHAATSSSFFIFDESSEIYDEIWTPCYAGTTDGEPFMICAGQMIKNTGEFYNVTFGDKAERWNTRVWDSRKSRFASKELIAEWVDEYGEDSDWVRVRVKGLPPRISSLQFIPQGLVGEARKRDHKPLDDEALIVGFDAANGGLAKFVFAFRRGLDAKSIPPIILPGDTPRDVVIATAAQILSDKSHGRRVTAMFGDQAYGSVILARLQGLGFTQTFEVNFGGASPDKHYYNHRAYVWGMMKNWLDMGAIPDEEKLAQQFSSPGFHDRNGKIVLESKEAMAKRRISSPDYADALACTFSRKVGPVSFEKPPAPKRSWNDGTSSSTSWMG